MPKIAFIFAICISFCLESAGFNCLILAAEFGKNTLRPTATAGDKDKSGSLPELKSQLLSKVLAHYPPRFWLDFLKARRNLIDESIAALIFSKASPYYAASPKIKYPILNPDESYSLKGLIEAGNIYRGRRKRLDIIELMEYYFINSIMWEKISFFYSGRRGKFRMPQIFFKEAFNFAFGRIEPEEIKVVLTNTGKIIYFSGDSHIVVIIDAGENYLRISDTSMQPVQKGDGTLCYICPGRGDEKYRGPYLNRSFQRIPLKKWLRKKKCFLPFSGNYDQMTHFKICGTRPFPMEFFPRKGVLTLLQTYNILKYKLGIENIQICLNTGLQQEPLLRLDDWYVEILKDDKAARIYVKEEWFSFIEQFYKLRELLSETELRKAGLASPPKGQAGADILNAPNGFQKSIVTYTAINASA